MRCSLFVFMLYTIVPALGSMDWCEYWVRVGKQKSRPECAGYELSESSRSRVQLAPERFRNHSERLKCPASEERGCVDCDLQCHNVTGTCQKTKNCIKRCICRPGLARNAQLECVPVEKCSQLTGTVMSSVKRMVPLLFKDVWKMMFSALRGASDGSFDSNSTLFEAN